MMIETDDEARSDYRLSMLINNRINGFLPVHVQQMNGKSTLSYEITSLENLPEFLDARKITYDEMVSLLLQFCSAVSEAGRYLLKYNVLKFFCKDWHKFYASRSVLL